ncbi:hypothetical protein Q5752_001709 [Cryptotrichosporon argae]
MLTSTSVRPAFLNRLCVDKLSRRLVSPYLYKTVEITRDTARLVFRGLDLPFTPPRAVSLAHDSHIDEQSDPKYIDSGDEGAQLDIPVKGNRGYPHKRSTSRKIQLLKHVEKVVVTSIPSVVLSQALHEFFLRRLSTMKSLTDAALPSVTEIVLSDDALFELADWQDRHRFQHHPFLRFLTIAFRPQQLCAKYPSPSLERTGRWLHLRRQRARQLDRTAEVDQFLLGFWPLFHKMHPLSVLTSLFDHWAVRALTLHNVVDQFLVAAPRASLRVFFRPCMCTSKAVPPAMCANHVTPLGRARVVNDVLSYGTVNFDTAIAQSVTGWRIAGIRSVAKGDVPLCEEPMFVDTTLLDGVPASVMARLAFPTLAAAAPCVCCGKK